MVGESGVELGHDANFHAARALILIKYVRTRGHGEISGTKGNLYGDAVGFRDKNKGKEKRKSFAEEYPEPFWLSHPIFPIPRRVPRRFSFSLLLRLLVRSLSLSLSLSLPPSLSLPFSLVLALVSTPGLISLRSEMFNHSVD